MTTDPPAFRLREVAVAAYGPTVVNATGHGAVLAVLALRASDLGADPATAAFVVALLGLGQLVASLPAGAMVARIGERSTLLVCGLVDAVAMGIAAVSTSVAVLGAAAALSGMTWSAFLLARQGFMIDAVPVAYRARALSTLGGTHRIGLFVGPLVGAGLIHVTDLRAAFWFAAGCSLVSGLLSRLMPDLGSAGRTEQRTAGHLSLWSVLREHRRVLLTLGTAVVVITAARSVRNALLPLWAEHIGLSPSTISLVLAFAAALDIALFYPGGALMDRRGRAVAAVPVVLAVAVGSMLLPLTSTAVGVGAVAGLAAVANGLGSGVAMTLGADAAPTLGRAQFLGGWRLCGDLGQGGGPLVVSAVASFAPLATASVVMGGLCLVGAGWVGFWTHREDVRRRAAVSRS